MTIYVLIVSGSDNVLGVYDSDLLALKRKLYFETVYKNDEIKMIAKDLEYWEWE